MLSIIFIIKEAKEKVLDFPRRTVVFLGGFFNIILICDFLFKEMESYSKELSNINTKKINKNNLNNHFIDAGLNITSKLVKAKVASGITLTNNKIKDIMKVIKSL